jgi:hypothetical protein
LAVLVAALGLAWLLVVASGIRAILGALMGWRVGVGVGVSHPGFDYLSYELFLAVAQVGLGERNLTPAA